MTPTKRQRRDEEPFSSFPQAIIQHIAFFIPVSEDFFSFLACFQDDRASETLGNLRHFLDLSTQLDPTDLWPHFRLRKLTPSLVPSVRGVARFFTTIFVFDVYDLQLLHQCLHPHNVVDLFSPPSYNQIHGWLKTPVSILPVQHITFASPNEETSDLFFEQLGLMPDLVSLTLHHSYLHLGNMDRLFDFIQASSKLTRLSLSMLYVSHRTERRVIVGRVMQTRPPPPILQRRHLEILTAWLRRCPVTSIKLKRWYVDDDDASSAVDFLNAIFASSTLKSVAMSNTTVAEFIATTTIPAPLRIESLDLSHSSLSETALVSLATGLRHSNVTSLNLGSNEIDGTGLQSLLEVLPTTSIQTFCLRWIDLDDNTFGSIAAALPWSKIVALDLSENLLTDRSAKELSDAVARAPRLSSLQLCGNKVTMQGAIALVTALSARSQVTTLLDLSGNSSDDADIEKLNSMVNQTSQIAKAIF
ncbi:unnamed protein product [Aphanomyces euteiches]|uniref:F-box domain-containing protein n=1 Tax=Aphanomyces euteiches TaxID=100861 RepID=A0A6G0X1U0_9STRA|nr:hypothetical protein Ae201684_009315 [Aphanomyces euteiches]KAH9070387.1 hypothetical protein Ae201684P_002746 [Aphanomyces euteiches]KAH9141919.1 hypothetical protein AeRB84_013992 [Aphanomyces euteiches]